MRQSIYWPTVFSFMDDKSIQESVVDACDRNGITTAIKVDSIDFEGTGNGHSIVSAINLIQPENIDDEDKDGLAKCLFLLAVVNTGKEPVVAVQAEEPSKMAPDSGKEKAVVVDEVEAVV